MRKIWVIGFLVLLIGCSTQEAAQAPTQTPFIIRQVVTSVVIQTQVVTATPKPPTATPKATTTPEATVAPEVTAPPAAGKWVVNKSTSSFDDSPTIVLMLPAENEITDSLGNAALPNLFLRCEEHVKEFYIHLDTRPDVEAGNLDGATVRMRFDSESAITENTSISTSGKAVFFEDTNRFIDLMLNHQKMAFEFTPFSSSPVETSFDLRGLSEAIAPLNEVCK